MALPIIAAAAFVVTAGLQLKKSHDEAVAIEKQAAFQKKQLEQNQRYAEIMASDATSRGDFLAKEIVRRGDLESTSLIGNARRLIGEQRASFAAQGVRVTSGSAQAVQDETEYLASLDAEKIRRTAALDALTVRNNAWREAFGYRQEARNLGTKKDLMLMAAKNEASSTLLTGALNAGGSLVQAGGVYYSNTGGTALTKSAPTYRGDFYSKHTYA